MRATISVRHEVRQALAGAVRALRRHQHELEFAQPEELQAADPAGARLAWQQLHAAGAALAGLPQPARLAQAMGAAVQRLMREPQLCTAQAVVVLEKSAVALLQHLDRLAQDPHASCVPLFPQYRDVQALAGVERPHPAELWAAPARQAEPAMPGAVALALDAATRTRLDAAMLPVLKSADAGAAGDLAALCLGVAQGLEPGGLRLFWRVAAGFFDGLAHGLVPADIHARRTASRVLLQYVAQAKGSEAVDAGLLHELDFFCALARTEGGAGGVDYAEEHPGRYDPAVLWGRQEGDAPGAIAAAPSIAALPTGLAQQLGLGISPALYNAYLGQAEEWSRALEKALHDWAGRPGHRLPDEAIACAQSLAGSSAALGFGPLSELAQALARALVHVQHCAAPQPRWPDALQAAAAEVRKLLHQFAAGFLKPASAAVLQELRVIAADPAAVCQPGAGGPALAHLARTGPDSLANSL